MKKLKPFDMNKKPNKPVWYLKLVQLVATPFYCLFTKSKVKTEKAVKKIKGPYFILATHHAFVDFPQLSYGLLPRYINWVVAIDEYWRGEWLLRGFGSIAKRKFTHDISTVRNIIYAIKELKQPVAIYPEARFSFAGINEKLDDGLGKMCKFLNVPIVMCKSNGNYINSPQWGKKPFRHVKKECNIYMLFTPEQLSEMTAEQIQERIEKEFVRDEYKWQVENNIRTKCKKRAEGLHRILYKCPVCGKEHMDSKGIYLWCNECGAKWEMDTLSRLNGINTDKGFSHIPDWYNWEREEVRKEVQNGTYHFEDDVRIEELFVPKFIPIGEAHLVHNKDGFTITGTANGQSFEVKKAVADMYSCHVEYDFFGRGDAIDIATKDNTYFMYPKTARNVMTKIHFATEELYDFYVRKK